MEEILGFDARLVMSLLAVIVGVMILIAPKLLNYLVAIYLIVIGVIGLYPHVAGGTADTAATTSPTVTSAP